MTVASTGDSGKLSRSTTAADVAKILRKRILAGAYSEQQFIRQETIAQELGVSRIPVREALTLLEAEGLLIREKYRGAVVPKLSLTEIDEIYALRLMIESYLLRSAISKITPAQIEHLQAVITRSRKTKDMSYTQRPTSPSRCNFSITCWFAPIAISRCSACFPPTRSRRATPSTSAFWIS
jgi:DNA-binding GntR family transcriptional regulator